MTTNNEAFEKWYHQYIDNGYSAQAFEVNMFEAWQAATTEANKRRAELESEVAELKEELDDVTQVATKVEPLIYDRVELQVSNKRLRDGIAEIAAEAQDTYTNAALTKLLSETPAESLQAHDDEVIEKCAKVCELLADDEESGHRLADGAMESAEVIRALKGK